jgi:hypothetical protein
MGLGLIEFHEAITSPLFPIGRQIFWRRNNAVRFIRWNSVIVDGNSATLN